MCFSITARIRTETMPNDTIIHSDRDSRTEEKLKVLTKYPTWDLKSVIAHGVRFLRIFPMPKL